MNLVEVMVASVVFALASGLSAQLWGQSVAWSRRVEERQEMLGQIDADLLRREGILRRQAAAASTGEEMDCMAAAQWLGERLSEGTKGLPPGVELNLDPSGGGEPGAVWLVVRAAEYRIERRRLFSAAAHGLCVPAASGGEVAA